MSVAADDKRRGMSMATRILLFSSVLLLALPWIGYRYIGEIRDFLLRGQEDAQLLAAGAVATVLHGRSELFYAVDEAVDIAAYKSALYVYPLENPVEVDGYPSDWGALQQQARSFADESVAYKRDGVKGQPVSFRMLLGEHGKYLYALLYVKDGTIVYRDPQYRRLDHSDHLRLEITTNNGIRRLILITDGEGQVSVYDMKPGWKLPQTGRPVNALKGVWRERADGYYLEFRLPANWLTASQRMKISAANVDDEAERLIDKIVSTQAEPAGGLNLLISRSPQLDRILQGLGNAETAICVVDMFRRIRGVYGGDGSTALCAQTEVVSGELVEQALAGERPVARYLNNDGESIIVAAYPVSGNDSVLGAVLVEKNSSHILWMQRQSLLRMAVASLVVFLIAILGLMLFAAWLAYRIRRLQKEVSGAIDADGRIVKERLAADQLAADEIGQLSRDFSQMLSRLKSYTGFLESVPRTLRHEILNPVNTISMSLQKLESGANDGLLLNGARMATQQLEMIVHSLTEAAHIEEALQQDEFEPFDLAAMVAEYVANSKLKHGNSIFKYSGPQRGVRLVGSDLRIAQLLDKLKDNALDFSEDGSTVEFGLKQEQGEIVLSVTNHGPVISQELLDVLFLGIVSSRSGASDRPHLGIGLYIANRIAQQHQGELKISNLYNMDGVRVSLYLPAVE